MKAIMMKL